LLARRGIPNVAERTVLYFRDVYDHLIRLHEQIDAGRDLLGNVMDGYLSMVANKTNDITKQLTIFATIFLPLSFITGFFGQNFDVLGQRGFFWLMLGSVFGLPIALLFWFRSKQWI
ncbi:MAG TPA: CorA family divalent cation transporter, partial [Archangium sp.]|nr:CorA family divalent cation transporter [Archangium sp.]